MHNWGDPGVDWKGISDAAAFIGEGLRRWGRVCVLSSKEKYGTVRVYCIFGWTCLESIRYPGYAYRQWPLWLEHSSWLVLKLNPLVIPMQQKLYRYFYRKAISRWPHLRLEILDAADYPELLENL